MEINEIEKFYDNACERKVRNFVYGNKRVDAAWDSLSSWAPVDGKNILEIGCGIGYMCWRLAQKYRNARVLGIDLSESSIAIANALFASKNVTFGSNEIGLLKLDDTYNLILLIDVYEHVAPEERSTLHSLIKKCSDHNTVIFLSFPTPRYLHWLRNNKPSEIQPIDENIDLDVIQILARETGKEVLYYGEVDIWNVGDFAHAALGKRDTVVPLSKPAVDMKMSNQEQYPLLNIVRSYKDNLRIKKGIKERKSLVFRRLGMDV